MKVITIIGADACGKDTQINFLKDHFTGLGKSVQVISIWDSLQEFQDLEDKKSLKTVVETILLKYEPHARSYFLLACLKNSLSRIQKEKDVVILNGFFEKYWASEVTYGVDSNLWSKAISDFIPSDTYVYLKTPAEVCLGRRSSWSNYESGKGRSVSGKQKTLEEFQTELHRNLDSLIATMGHKVHRVSGNQSEAGVLSEILKVL